MAASNYATGIIYGCLLPHLALLIINLGSKLAAMFNI
jgi:hypothetical protein